MKVAVGISVAVILATAGAGESGAQVAPKASGGIASGEAVTILDDDRGIPACVRRAMASVSPRLRIIPGDAFRAALFPWFEPGTAPGTREELATLLEKTLVRDRITKLRVRYVISASGGTTESRGKGFAVGGSKGGLGLAWWGKESNLSAAVWDLKKADSAGSFKAKSSGTAVMPVFLLPIPLVPSTESSACHKLGRQLTAFVTGAQIEPSSTAQPRRDALETR